jgi:hypothetical protein
MKLIELIEGTKEQERVDELVKPIAKGVGKVIGGVAKGIGALAGIGAGLKKAYQTGKQASTDVIGGTRQGADAPAQPQAGSGGAAATQPAAGRAAGATTQPAAGATTQPAAGATTQPAAGGAADTATTQPTATKGAAQNLVKSLTDRVMALDLDDQRDILSHLEKLPATTEPAAKEQPAAQPAADVNAAPKPAAGAAQSAAQSQGTTGELTQGQKDQQLANQQIKATAKANAAASGQRNEVETAAKAAAAKSGFQRTADDKLAIKRAQEMGIKVESRQIKKKVFENPISSLASAHKAASGTVQSAVKKATSPGEWQIPSQSYQSAKAKTSDRIMKIADPSRWFEKSQSKPVDTEPQKARAATPTPRKKEMLLVIDRVESSSKLSKTDLKVIELIYNGIENNKFSTINDYLKQNPGFQRESMTALANVTYGNPTATDLENVKILKSLLSKER